MTHPHSSAAHLPPFARSWGHAWHHHHHHHRARRSLWAGVAMLAASAWLLAHALHAPYGFGLFGVGAFLLGVGGLFRLARGARLFRAMHGGHGGCGGTWDEDHGGREHRHGGWSEHRHEAAHAHRHGGCARGEWHGRWARYAEADPRTEKVNAIADRVVAEVRSGPEVLRALGHDPEKTAEALRQTLHAISARERQVRAAVGEPGEARLAEERSRLVSRLEGETDAVVKERLTAALASLDEQRKQRDELLVAAKRLEAEHTRLFFELQRLHTQILRVKAADAGAAEVAGAGLKSALEQLAREIDAVADSLTESGRPDEQA